jgi:hypothetical protein
VYEYRLAAEKSLGRLLRRDEVIHHTNSDPSDSNPSILSPMSQRLHAALEAEIKYRDVDTGLRKSGVSFVAKFGKWRARGWQNGREVHLGVFASESLARDAVQAFWATKPILQREVSTCA